MVQIVITVCSILSTQQCKLVRLTYTDVPLVQCMMGYQAQAYIAEWSAANPNWSVRRWRCEVPGHVAKA